MKTLKSLLLPAVAAVLAVSPVAGLAADEKKDAKVKPYPLDTCIVADEKLGADPNMKPYTFTVGDQEVKLCCKSCLKDFKKDEAKYLKKIAAAPKKK